MYKIFIIEDDHKISQLISEHLKKYDLVTQVCNSFDRIMSEIEAYEPHLILLDINLPKFDGFYWCSEIRKVSKIPILFLSSRNSNMDIIMALNMGGDDFVQKPFSMEILTTKIMTLIRRAYAYTDKTLSIMEKGGKILDLNARKLLFNGVEVALTANEFGILSILFENFERIVSREKIIKRLWDDESFVDDNTLTVNINRLRKKLEDEGLTEFIHTVKGKGYVIR
ncbi:MAG TPA: response regulator transcription factor [Thermotogota bacterium]|mgnify:CR=1 FL=1|nr:response regulator transcription factor [Thermotogota bacterium]HPJ89426.1 response regulator transcription factor [Thermotogota bacterium]HPR96570.1 response regulator transcription factor [Thermotogota bacterium]